MDKADIWLLPDFKLPIEDRNTAQFWLMEWDTRFHQTKDYGFKEAADAMRIYIFQHFDEADDG